MITYDAATIYITSYYLYPIYNRIPSLQVIKKSKKKKISLLIPTYFML